LIDLAEYGIGNEGVVDIGWRGGQMMGREDRAPAMMENYGRDTICRGGVIPRHETPARWQGSIPFAAGQGSSSMHHPATIKIGSLPERPQS